MKRYSNIEYVLNLELEEFYNLLKEIERQNKLEIKEKQEQMYLDIYLAMYQKMYKDNFVSYEEFRNKIKEDETENNINDNKSNEEIYKELEEIYISFRGKEEHD